MPPGSTVLLECLSNLTANELYDPAGAKEEVRKGRAGRYSAVCARQADTLIRGQQMRYFQTGYRMMIPCCSIFRYLAEGSTSRQLRLPTRVTEVVYGIPVPIKQRSAGSRKGDETI